MRGDKNCARDAAVGKISLFYAADSNFFSKARHVSNLPTGTLDLCNDSFYITRNFRSQFPNGIQDWFIQPLLSKLNINMIEDCKPFFFYTLHRRFFSLFFVIFQVLIYYLFIGIVELSIIEVTCFEKKKLERERGKNQMQLMDGVSYILNWVI